MIKEGSMMRIDLRLTVHKSLSCGCVFIIFPAKKCCYTLEHYRKKGNVLFNDALKTLYLRLYGVIDMVTDHSDSERGNPLLPHWLLFPINSKGSFICIIPQTG